MTDDLLKWAINLTEEFRIEIENKMEGLFYNEEYIFGSYQDILEDETYFPLLLFKAVLGLNKISSANWINIEGDCVQCYLDHDEEDVTYFYKDLDNEENAIIAGLILFYNRGIT